MTTQAWTSTNDISDDTKWRAAGSEMNAKFAAVGLIQTADTGQINWVTSPWPNPTLPQSGSFVSNAGYEIWRFNDSLQATAPIFIKIEYMVNRYLQSFIVYAGVMGFYLTVGTGSDGAGGITGIKTTRRLVNNTQSSQNIIGSIPSYLCYKDGFLGLLYKLGNPGGYSSSAFTICRTCDNAGAWTATGCVVYMRDESITPTGCYVQALRFAATAEAYPASGSGGGAGVSMVPHYRTAVIGTDNPIYLHWMPIPEMVPVLGMCTHVSIQYGVGVFQAALVGATLRSYFTPGTIGFLGYGANNSGSFSMAMLWE